MEEDIQLEYEEATEDINYDDVEDSDYAHVSEPVVEEEPLPTDCVIISIEGGKVEPVIQVRGKYADLNETLSVLSYVRERVRFLKFVQERS